MPESVRVAAGVDESWRTASQRCRLADAAGAAWCVPNVRGLRRYTLLDRSAEPLIALAAERGSAMLVKGPDQFPRSTYRDAPSALIDRTRRLAALAAEYGVPLRFSTRDPCITSTIVGITHPERIAQTLDL
jgi:aryl-alcohol dehydrogenase-like predicted oxidoreductase